LGRCAVGGAPAPGFAGRWVVASFGMGSLSKRRSFPSRSAGGIQSVDSAFPKVCRVDSSRHGGTGMTAACNAHGSQMKPVPGGASQTRWHDRLGKCRSGGFESYLQNHGGKQANGNWTNCAVLPNAAKFSVPTGKRPVVPMESLRVSVYCG